jgi:F-box and leucine-rich repeat protein GRR1
MTSNNSVARPHQVRFYYSSSTPSLLTQAEFTEHQRNVFCVFSGKGVNDLRTYLNKNGVEDDFDSEAREDAEDDQTMTGLMGATALNGDEDADGDEELDADGDDGAQT